VITDIEIIRQREEATRNRQRLADWWERYCEARPMIWALGTRPPAINHPFRREPCDRLPTYSL
jgi:hypothetical protein